MPLKIASPVPVVLASLVAALDSDATLQAILASPGIYSGRAPNSAAMPYIVIDDVTAGAAPTFTGNIGRGSFRLKMWAKDLPALLDIYKRVGVLLDGVALDLGPTLQQVGAKAELTATITEPGANAGEQGIVNYEWSAQLVA